MKKVMSFAKYTLLLNVVVFFTCWLGGNWYRGEDLFTWSSPAESYTLPSGTNLILHPADRDTACLMMGPSSLNRKEYDDEFVMFEYKTTRRRKLHEEECEFPSFPVVKLSEWNSYEELIKSFPERRQQREAQERRLREFIERAQID